MLIGFPSRGVTEGKTYRTSIIYCGNLNSFGALTCVRLNEVCHLRILLPSSGPVSAVDQISGICYSSDVFQVRQVLYVPGWLAKFCSWALEPIFSSSEPTTEARIGMGATVDIQRQQRMELLDRQLMLSQFAQVRRQRQQQVNDNCDKNPKMLCGLREPLL
ncbi:hypothetical protein CB1_060782090 [Camelus ferus]|nr:hypothetical protein CB1_060782090 [Camelus ferus]